MLNLEKLRKIREMKGFSQSEIARLSNIAASHYNNVERGLKGVSTDTLSVICQVLQISISDIWDSSDDTIPPILPVRDNNSIIVERSTSTVRFILPPTPEAFQFVSRHITGENIEIKPEFKTIVDKWGQADEQSKAKILKILCGDESDIENNTPPN